MIKSGIYKIINLINNKIYIGSAVNLDNRKNVHFTILKKNKHHNIKLQRSFNKYEKENFKFEILEYCEKENLIKREQYYIDNLTPYYNIAKIAGSNLGSKRTLDTRRQLSKSHKGQIAWNKNIPQTEEHKRKQSISMTGRISGAKGKKWPLLSRKKFSLSKKGISANNRIQVIQFDLRGNKLAEFDSVTSAEIATNTKGITHVLLGKYKHANNYLWKRKVEYQLL